MSERVRSKLVVFWHLSLLLLLLLLLDFAQLVQNVDLQKQKLFFCFDFDSWSFFCDLNFAKTSLKSKLKLKEVSFFLENDHSIF